MRVFLYQNLKNEAGTDTWLAWGQIVVQTLTIAKDPDFEHQGASNVSDPNQWVTSGTYKILKIYDPEYQVIATNHETPEGMSYFGGKT